MSRCRVCIKELNCEFYHDDTSCDFSPIAKTCLCCGTMFEIFDIEDKFCSNECKAEYTFRIKIDKSTLEIKKKMKRFSRMDAVQLDYLNTLEVELIGN